MSSVHTKTNNHHPDKIELYDTLHANTMRQVNHAKITCVVTNCSAATLLITNILSLINNNSDPNYTQLGLALLMFYLGQMAHNSAQTYKKQAQKYHRKAIKLQKQR